MFRRTVAALGGAGDPIIRPFDFLPASLSKWTRSRLLRGILLLIVSDRRRVFSARPTSSRSYLVGFLFSWGLALGCLGILMLQYLTGGAWGVVSRRTLEAATRTLPLLALLSSPSSSASRSSMTGPTPIWWRANASSPSPPLDESGSVHHSRNHLLRHLDRLRLAAEQLVRRTGCRRPLSQALHRLCAPGLIVYVFTVTFSSVDWAESLTNDWYSTMWGFLFVAMQGLSAMAFIIVVLALLSQPRTHGLVLKPVHFHDLGKMLLMFVMLWAYFSFSQLLIVWAGNLTDEISWYLRRMGTSWGWLGARSSSCSSSCRSCCFFSRAQAQPQSCSPAWWASFCHAHWIDLLWIVMPSYYEHGFRFTGSTSPLPLGLGGVWFGGFLWRLGKRPLMPVHATNLEAALTSCRSLNRVFERLADMRTLVTGVHRIEGCRRAVHQSTRARRPVGTAPPGHPLRTPRTSPRRRAHRRLRPVREWVSRSSCISTSPPSSITGPPSARRRSPSSSRRPRAPQPRLQASPTARPRRISA